LYKKTQGRAGATRVAVVAVTLG